MADKLTLEDAARQLYETHQGASLAIATGLEAAVPWDSLASHAQAAWYRVLAKAMQIALRAGKESKDG